MEPHLYLLLIMLTTTTVFCVRVEDIPFYSNDFTVLNIPEIAKSAGIIATCNTAAHVTTGSTVTFTSPNYPNAYPRKACQWLFYATEPNVQIQIDCQAFDISAPFMGHCLRDTLFFYTTLSDVKSFCGNTKPSDVKSVGQWIYSFFRPSLFMAGGHKGFTCTAIGVAPTTTPQPTTTTTTTPKPITTTTTTPKPTTTTTTTPKPTTTTTTTPKPTTTTTTTPKPTTTTTTTPKPTTTTTTTPKPTTTTTTTPKPTTSTTTTPKPTTTTTTTPKPTTTTTPKPCECGRKGPPAVTRIVGGKDTGLHEYPWQAALVRKSDPSQVICGASIINDQFVLTAAHCLIDPNVVAQLQVSFGEHDRTLTTETNETIYRGINTTIPHASFNFATSDNDIALVKLSEPIDLDASAAIKPICFPNSTNLYENTQSATTGWGLLTTVGSQPNILQHVNVTTMTNADCQTKYGASKPITANMICATDLGKDTCQGDSGGPLIVQDGDHYVLVGLTSFKILCANPNFPGIYTRVGNYIGWINNKVGTVKTCMV